MEISHVVNEDGSMDMQISLSAVDMVSLKHDLQGVEGVVKWISEGPLKNKVAACQKRMLEHSKAELLEHLSEQEMSLAEYKALIASPALAAPVIAAIPAYKDRLARDAIEDFARKPVEVIKETPIEP